MNNFYRKLQVLNEKSCSFVTDSTLLCVWLRASDRETMHWLYHPLWLSFCVSLNFPTSPYLVLECYRRQFADHSRMKVGRSFWNTQKNITNKSAIVFEKCNHNNRQSLIRSRGYSEHSLINLFQLRLWSTLLWDVHFFLIFKSLIMELHMIFHLKNVTIKVCGFLC